VTSEARGSRAGGPSRAGGHSLTEGSDHAPVNEDWAKTLVFCGSAMNRDAKMRRGKAVNRRRKYVPFFSGIMNLAGGLFSVLEVRALGLVRRALRRPRRPSCVPHVLGLQVLLRPRAGSSWRAVRVWASPFVVFGTFSMFSGPRRSSSPSPKCWPESTGAGGSS